MQPPHHASNPHPRPDASIVDLIPALRAFARTFYRDPYDADDLVQDTLAKAIANLDKFESGTRMKSWLFTIMRNAFYNRIVSSNRERPGLAECASQALLKEPTQEWSLRGQELLAAINRLPPHYREVLVLIGILGESYDATAEICGCAMGTVKSRFNRARAAVLQQLGEPSAAALLEAVTPLAASGTQGAGQFGLSF